MKNYFRLCFAALLFFTLTNVSAQLKTATDSPYCVQWSGSCKTSGQIYRTGSVQIGLNNTPSFMFRLAVSSDAGSEVPGTGGAIYAKGGIALYAEGLSQFEGDVEMSNGDLKVYNTVFAKKFHVKLPPFPDYVFADDYSLTPIDELKAYINKNKHLPNIPTADVIDQDGADVGDLQVRQMEKIEELTLYIIELNDRIKLLENAIEKTQD